MNHSASFFGSAHGKILLFGEYSVLWKHPALGFSLPWTTQVRFTPVKHPVASLEESGKEQLECIFDFPVEQAKKRELQGILYDCLLWAQKRFPELFSLFLERFSLLFPELLSSSFPPGEFLKKVHVCVRSNIPVGLGYGSSAALCNAMAQAFFSVLLLEQKKTFKKKDFSWKENGMVSSWEKMGEELEHFFHGKSSGIDPFLSAHSGFFGLSFQKERKDSAMSDEESGRFKAQKLFFPSLGVLVGASTQREKSVKEAVGMIQKRFLKEKSVQDQIDFLGKITHNLLGFFLKNSKKSSEDQGREPRRDQASVQSLLVSSFEQAAGTLRSLGLYTAVMEKMESCALREGALGGKMVGAGFGGGMCFLASTMEHAHEIAGALKKEGFAQWHDPWIKNF